MGLFSNIARDFNLDKWWKCYSRAHKTTGIISLYYTCRYMRMATKSGGYCGRETVIKGKPHMPHGFHGVHISRKATIGSGVTILQNVTIGNVNDTGATIGDGCFIGAGAIILGDISIGENVKIGAGAVVVDDIPDNCTVVGPKAHIHMAGRNREGGTLNRITIKPDVAGES